jgi:hypothetical protein
VGTIPTPPTFTAGAVLTAAQLNSLGTVQSFWASPPQCYAYLNATATTVSGTWLLVPLQAEMFDVVQSGDSPSHDNTTNNSRIYFRTAGKYEVSGQVGFTVNTNGYRQAEVKINSGGVETGGTQVVQSGQSPTSTIVTAVPIVPVAVSVAAGDYVELFANQNSGGNLDLFAGSGRTFLRTRLISA